MTSILDDVKAWLQLPQHVEASTEPLLPLAVAAATTAVTDYTGHDQSNIVTVDTAATVRIFEAGSPVVGQYASVWLDDLVGTPTLVEESSDRVTWTTSDDWWMSPDNEATQYRLCRATCWPAWVRVTAKWGIDQTLADDLRMPTVMKAARLYSRRKSITGIEGFSDFGPVRVSRSEDPDIAALLDQLRRHDYAIGIG